MSHLQLLTKTITDQRAWKASTVDQRTSWYYPHSENCLYALEQTILALRREARPTTEIQLSDYPCAAFAGELKPVLTTLESGRGFAIIDGIPVDRYSVQEVQAIYWIVGQMLGCPFEQNVQGTLLYDVRDTGQDVKLGARFSVTNDESTFHTDNSFGEEILDYVGLLCMHTAKAGGLNQIISAYALHNELLDKHPDVLEALYQPFHVDRRGGIKEGERPTTQVPILQWDGQELTCRYLRYWIEVGHEKTDEPLTPAQVKALDVLDNLLQRRDLMVEFALQAGQVLFMNNRWILHNRTAFEDYPELDRRRHYVRLWLKKLQ